jgi:hypothetical protein
MIGPYLNQTPLEPKFSQIYIYDASAQFKRRSEIFKDLDKNLLLRLQKILHDSNPYARIYQQMGEKIKAEPAKGN